MIKKFFSNIPKSKTKDAFRLAIQSAISASVTYTTLTVFNLPEVFVGVLSAVLVVEPSIGNTLEQSKGRVTATVVGSIIGFICVVLIPYGGATVISLIITMFIMNAIASFRPSWRYGVVAALAIAMGSPDDAIDMSVDRITSIFIGIVVGIVVSLIIWPEKASSRADKHLRLALKAAAQRFENAVENTRTSGAEDRKTSSKFHKSLSDAKEALQAVKIENVNQLKKQIQNVERLYNSILIIHRVALHSNTGVSDGDAGIEKDTEKVKETACEITISLANNEEVDRKQLEEFKACVDTVKTNLEYSETDGDLNILRNTLLFGITEIKAAILDLCEYIPEESNEEDS